MSANPEGVLRAWPRLLVAVLLLGLAGCASLGPAQRERAIAIAAQARETTVDCTRADACATHSPLRDLGARAFTRSTDGAPVHYAVLLESGSDAMLARLNLIRSATTRIDLQTYIFDQDDAGQLFIEELLAAARRGVKVRVLIDQLSALEKVETLAALAGAHENFALRVYNPTFGRARPNYLHYALSVLCCFRDFNQRMHNKLLLVDGAIAITGGRNYQNDYYDWDAQYNFRDRDLLVAGPVTREMDASFEAFWAGRRTIPAAELADVGGHILRKGVPPLTPPEYTHPDRVAEASADASDSALVQERLVARALPVGAVNFISDMPDKHHAEVPGQGEEATDGLYNLIASAEEEVLVQTPYLILSGAAQDLFRALQARDDPPRVVISTNSLAATDAFMVYALSFKYRRRYMREMGFEIYEYKPFPADAPIDLAATRADPNGGMPPVRLVNGRRVGGSAVRQRLRTETRPSYLGTRAVTEPVPLKRAGVRIGMHAKSLVVDDRVGVVGTHNFDPRSDNYNTENAVVIADPAFAAALAASIRQDIAPANSWVIAPRDRPPVFSGLDYSVAKLSEMLPLFDLWPLRYGTSYEFRPGPECPTPLRPSDPRFRDCYEPVGDFPEVALGPKWMYTRILIAFGAGLAPIL
jgi:phosphatidylserine/phosphatidylglycerophosphate/cardiolipin synthase-like enzyme